MSTLYPIQTRTDNGEIVGDSAPAAISKYNRTGGTAVPGNTIHVYIDGQGSNGNDANDGLVPVQGAGTSGPLKTIGAVYEKFPDRPFAGCRIIVNCIGPTSGTPTVYTERTLYLDGGEPLVNPFRFRGGCVVGGVFVVQKILGVPTTGPATAALDVVPATALSLTNANGASVPLRTQLNFTTAAPGWTANDFPGKKFWVRVTRSGVLSYFHLPISGNTADTLIVDTLGIVGDILATDVVEIVTSPVQFQGPNVPDNNDVAVQGVVGTTGPQLNNGSTFNENGGSVFENIDWNGNMIARGTMCLSFDCCALPLGGTILSIDNLTWNNCIMQRSSFNIIITRFSRSPGQSRRYSPTVPRLNSATAPQVSVCGYETTLQFGINGNNATEFIPLGSGNMVFAYPVGMWKSRPRIAGETRLGSALSVGGPAGFVSFNAGVAFIGDTDTGFIAAGALPAVRTRNGSQIRLDPAVTAITGKGGVDLQLETGPAIAIGAGAGQFMEADGFNGNFYRGQAGSPGAPLGDGSRIMQRAEVTTEIDFPAVQTAVFTAKIGRFYRLNPTGAGFVVNLPVAGAHNKGLRIEFKKTVTSANAITFTPNGVQTVDGAASYVWDQATKQSGALVSDGVSNWEVI